MGKSGMLMGVGVVAVMVVMAIGAVLMVMQSKKKNKNKNKQIKTMTSRNKFYFHDDIEQHPEKSINSNTIVRSSSTDDDKLSFEPSISTSKLPPPNLNPNRNRYEKPPLMAVSVETYTIEQLRTATNDFSSCNHIEGSVYQGRLNGKNLAIKRTNPETISKVEFKLFQTPSKQHQPSIIKLIGACNSSDNNPDSFLVFEYAKNGSLKDWLHGGLAMKNQFISSCNCFLSWSQRLRICLDVAASLQYMHHIMNPVYVHGNIKSRNIFLDDELKAKIGNFGMAQCVEDVRRNDPQEFHSKNMGYLAPEYVHQGIVSPAVDVFAFGVVLLEVLFGKTPVIRTNKKGRTIYLSHKIKSIMRSVNCREKLRAWMDNALGSNYPFDSAVAMARLAGACVEEEHQMRPSAAEIVEELSRLVEELQPEGDQHWRISTAKSPYFSNV